jgi:hypothetical protein
VWELWGWGKKVGPMPAFLTIFLSQLKQNPRRPLICCGVTRKMKNQDNKTAGHGRV